MPYLAKEGNRQQKPFVVPDDNPENEKKGTVPKISLGTSQMGSIATLALCAQATECSSGHRLLDDVAFFAW